MSKPVILLALTASMASAQNPPEQWPQQPFHLTARPWQQLAIPSSTYLDAIEGVCRFTARIQDASGAVIDPFLRTEHQYATPYFAFAVGALIHAGRAADLLENGIRAMDHATNCFARGDAGIPDAHGEFFLASLPGALALYEGHVPGEKIALWRERLRTPREQIVHGGTNNWRAYAMKGEWLRAKSGLMDREDATAFIEESWLRAQQRDRIAFDRWNLYEDGQTDPESHAVEGVGRGNLLALIDEGYDGKSHEEMRRFVERGTEVSLLLQDPSGQCPPGGRTSDHVWNDVLDTLCFDVMAERTQQTGDLYRAGQFRHAAMLSFASIHRWQRDDGTWAGSYYVTKNHFDPADRVGYQPASNYTNYNGALMLHLAEAYLARRTNIPEKPAPVEIGGYAFTTDPKFASAVANAGGMQLFAALRGDTARKFERYWTALGVERFGRAGWDSRLGPSDGERDAATGHGVTFAPTWLENGKWIRLADVPDRYQGRFSVQFIHPLLVRCAIDYAPIHGPWPVFRHEFVLTPDGVLATLKSNGAQAFGVTWPLIEDDGKPLSDRITDRVAAASYSPDGDEQCFLSLNAGAPVTQDEERIRSTYGWLRPIRAMAVNGVSQTFVYPRSPGDPAGEKVRESFRLTPDGFESPLGSVRGTIYVGRTAAGGEGRSVDCSGDGKAVVTFDTICRFVLQLRRGKITAIETDRKTSAHVGDKIIHLDAYVPVNINS